MWKSLLTSPSHCSTLQQHARDTSSPPFSQTSTWRLKSYGTKVSVLTSWQFIHGLLIGLLLWEETSGLTLARISPWPHCISWRNDKMTSYEKIVWTRKDKTMGMWTECSSEWSPIYCFTNHETKIPLRVASFLFCGEYLILTHIQKIWMPLILKQNHVD